MIENTDPTSLDQDQIDHYFNEGSMEFLTGNLRELQQHQQQQLFLDTNLPRQIEEAFQSVPPDLRYVDSADLIKLNVDPDIAQPPLSDLIVKSGNSISNIPENISIPANISSNLDEHNNAGMDFELFLNNNNSGKNWYYSPALRKVFIKLDKSMYIDILYTPKIPNESLFLRAMMVYVNNPFSPVQRCQNHLHADKTVEHNIRNSVLRSDNSNVRYTGDPDGKSFNNRLSVLITLGIEKPDEKHQIKQSVALKFVCQNSCLGREPTAVIFTLENRTGEVLGKRVIHVKVCSCPKRDKQNDEKKYFDTRKRENTDYDTHPDKKPAKVMKIKEEPETTSTTVAPSPMLMSPPTSPDTGTGTPFTLRVELPNSYIAHEAVKAIFGAVTVQMARNPRDSEQYAKCYKHLNKLLDKFENISTDNV